MGRASTKVRFEPKTRATLRIIEPGEWGRCAHCGERVKFKSAQKVKPRQVIANRYADGKWIDCVSFHESCYKEAGDPCGPADKRMPMRK